MITVRQICEQMTVTNGYLSPDSWENANYVEYNTHLDSSYRQVTKVTAYLGTNVTGYCTPAELDMFKRHAAKRIFSELYADIVDDVIRCKQDAHYGDRNTVICQLDKILKKLSITND